MVISRVIGDDSGMATDIDRLLVFFETAYTIVHLDRERRFFELITRISSRNVAKTSAKIHTFEVS